MAHIVQLPGLVESSSLRALWACSALALPAAAQSTSLFTEGQQFLQGGAVSHLAVGDLNGNGRVDVLTTSYCPGGTLLFNRNAGRGEFANPQFLFFGGYTTGDGELHDLDGDGDLDVLVFKVYLSTFNWLENLGAFQFGPAQSVAAGQGVSDGGAVDLDGDGDVDVYCGASALDSVLWIENLGGGAFAPPQVVSETVKSPLALAHGDIDQDGDPDLVSASWFGPGRVSWHENMGAGAYFQRVLDLGVLAAQLQVIDFDGDGRPDVLGVSEDQGLVWWRNQGNDNFADYQVLIGPEPQLNRFHAALVDGDALPDLLVSSSASGGFQWYANQGAGQVGLAEEIASPTINRPWAVRAADVDGDGDNDLIGTTNPLDCEAQAGYLYVYENKQTAGISFCSSAVNSTGQESFLQAQGSNSLAEESLSLRATAAPPGQPGLFYAGPQTQQLPFGDGVRCVGGTVLRLGAPVPEQGGTFDLTVDFGIFSGQIGLYNITTYFQCWYRDPAAGGAGFNLSDGLSLIWRN